MHLYIYFIHFLKFNFLIFHLKFKYYHFIILNHVLNFQYFFIYLKYLFLNSKFFKQIFRNHFFLHSQLLIIFIINFQNIILIVILSKCIKFNYYTYMISYICF